MAVTVSFSELTFRRVTEAGDVGKTMRDLVDLLAKAPIGYRERWLRAIARDNRNVRDSQPRLEASEEHCMVELKDGSLHTYWPASINAGRSDQFILDQTVERTKMSNSYFHTGKESPRVCAR